MAKVLRLAQLERWVASLPAGLATPVGERGTQVSGGQRQRIALARTLLADPPVLVLDEPTAGLDDLTADRLLTDVLAAAVGRSVILVTHRPSEASGFDTVVVLGRGRMVGQRTGVALGPSTWRPRGQHAARLTEMCHADRGTDLTGPSALQPSTLAFQTCLMMPTRPGHPQSQPRLAIAEAVLGPRASEHSVSWSGGMP